MVNFLVVTLSANLAKIQTDDKTQQLTANKTGNYSSDAPLIQSINISSAPVTRMAKDEPQSEESSSENDLTAKKSTNEKKFETRSNKLHKKSSFTRIRATYARLKQIFQRDNVTVGRPRSPSKFTQGQGNKTWEAQSSGSRSKETLSRSSTSNYARKSERVRKHDITSHKTQNSEDENPSNDETSMFRKLHRQASLESSNQDESESHDASQSRTNHHKHLRRSKSDPSASSNHQKRAHRREKREAYIKNKYLVAPHRDYTHPNELFPHKKFSALKIGAAKLDSMLNSRDKMMFNEHYREKLDIYLELIQRCIIFIDKLFSNDKSAYFEYEKLIRSYTNFLNNLLTTVKCYHQHTIMKNPNSISFDYIFYHRDHDYNKLTTDLDCIQKILSE